MFIEVRVYVEFGFVVCWESVYFDLNIIWFNVEVLCNVFYKFEYFLEIGWFDRIGGI